MATSKAFEKEMTEVDSLVGIGLAIVGNILISFALNIQKIAHNQLSVEKLDNTQPHSSCTSQSQITPHALEQANSHNSLENNSASNDDMRYLYSKTWWLGILLMIGGEIGNFTAYGFAPASIIAPLGTTTLISNAMLAPFLLNETFRRRDFMGVLFAMAGAAAVVFSSRSKETKLTPELVTEALFQTRSLVFYLFTLLLILVLTLLSPRHGQKNIFIDLGLVAVYGAYTVLATKSLSSLLNLTLYRLFTYTISYVLIVVLVSSAVMQIKYLSRALQRFDSTAVIPTQFVLFTISAIVGSAVIYHDFDDEDCMHMSWFLVGCFTEFMGVYLITSNRNRPSPGVQEWKSPDLKHDFEPVGKMNFSSEAMDVPCDEQTPLVPHNSSERSIDYDGHRLTPVLSQNTRRNSIFPGLSLHSQLASMGEES
ncbi:magnesium transporter NIPA-domain-containing protein [Phycomyces nitens]|nr:magnesium transporter NIPA-domain-containing protein [Phycomyces nitens]